MLRQGVVSTTRAVVLLPMEERLHFGRASRFVSHHKVAAENPEAWLMWQRAIVMRKSRKRGTSYRGLPTIGALGKGKLLGRVERTYGVLPRGVLDHPSSRPRFHTTYHAAYGAWYPAFGSYSCMRPFSGWGWICETVAAIDSGLQGAE